MRRTMLVVLGVLSLTFIAGCAAPTVDTSPATEQPTEPANPPQATVAGIGDTLEIAGSETSLHVTLLALKDPARGYNEFNAPEAGKHYVAVKLAIKNVGDAAYNDSPSNGSAMTDTSDVGYNASMFDEIPPALGSIKIAPGNRRVGWITFLLPKGAKPAAFQFTPESGFADETGEWALR